MVYKFFNKKTGSGVTSKKKAKWNEIKINENACPRIG